MFARVQGFAPDADPSEPGVLLDCDLLIPTIRGMRSLPGDANAGIGSLPSTVASVISLYNLDESIRVLASTAGSGSAAVSQLYELSGQTWTDRGGASSPYTATANARWSFAPYGDAVYAAQKGHVIQCSSGAGTAFTAVAGAPQAAFVISVGEFVMAFNTTDATYGDSPHRWWCSKAGDPQSWTADIATQATTGLLTDGTGPIIGAERVGQNVVAFKRHAGYLGRYVGAPVVWAWERLPGDGWGLYSHHSLVSIEGIGILFPGRDNFYVFDGARAQPIGTNRVAEFFIQDLDDTYASRMVGFHNRETWNVYWWYPSTSGAKNDGTLDRFLAYNYRADRWGYGRKEALFAFEYLEPGLSYDGVGDHYNTWDDIPNASYDTVFASQGRFKSAVVESDGLIYKLEGQGNDSYYTTGFIGQDSAISRLTRMRPRFREAPMTGTQQLRYTDQLGGGTATISQTRAMTSGSFDHVWRARWISVKHSYTGNMELMGIDADFAPDSRE